MASSRTPADPLLREPGQAVTPEYARDGRLRYEAEDGAIVIRNGPYVNNRPLYAPADTDAAALAGDRPLVRLIAKPYEHGTLGLAVARGDRAIWVHDSADIRFAYRCGRARWTCTDPTLPGLVVEVDAVPFGDDAGFAARVDVTGARPDDRLIWTFAGARECVQDPRNEWEPISWGNPDVRRDGDPRRPVLSIGLDPERSRGNVVEAGADGFRLAAGTAATRIAVGRFDVPVAASVGDATALADAASLLASAPTGHPVAVGAIDLDGRVTALHLAVRIVDAGAPDAVAPEPAGAFAAAVDALARIELLTSRSPDPRLDAAVTAVCHAVDANCERDPAIFRHGAMAFNIRFIGWRVICGATMLGQHDRVLDNARYTIGLQKTSDPDRIAASPDVSKLRTHEGPDSRYRGAGYLDDGNGLHETQTQFFDQTIADWRATADPAMEALLRPALELHCEWMRACFDPDGDGLYESYINTLPTDSVWYGGGGSVEESAYAYVAHRAARDLARRAGDAAEAARHDAQLARIAAGLREKLWLPDRGHFGAFVEQGGHHRVHPDAWALSAFLPIDAGIVTPLEAVQSLYYTEWAFERIPMGYGGELRQMSNWVPWKWSTRDMFSGDLLGLALAYFQTGLGDAGYEILRGVTHEGCFASAVPGGFSHIGAGTDFGDSVHIYARTVVEGLYGYVPDYPNGRVLFRPALPAAWTEAAVETPDFSLAFSQDGDADVYRISVATPADVAVRVPVRARRIARVTVDGVEVPVAVEPWFGCTQATVDIPAGGVPAGAVLEVRFELEDRVAQSEPIDLTGEVGERIRCAVASDAPVVWSDLHEILEGPATGADAIEGVLAPKPGHHLILAELRTGDLPRWQVVRIRIDDTASELAHAARTPRAPQSMSGWECIDLDGARNGDIREIFQQEYLSPRPETCSLRVGTDGWSCWTFPHWGLTPPRIGLDAVAGMKDASGRIVTPQGVPFAPWPAERNVAFTSLWDNWPTSARVPVGRVGDTAWALVAGSTFPMQTAIANAVLRFAYADGVVETLDLVPPVNFWMLSTWGGEDYDLANDAGALPAEPPVQVQLGPDCRAMLLSWTLRPGIELESVTLETLSEEVVVGLVGLTIETHDVTS